MGEEGFDTHTDLEKKIVEVFDVFDHAGNKTVDVREIGTIIRSLGCCPSEQDVQEIIAQVEDEQASGSVQFGKFLPIVLEIIRENKLQPADPEMLLKAFLVLDEHKKGFVTKEELSKAMMEEGEQFTQEEVDEMLTVAVDSETGIIPYEYYLNQLMMTKDIYTFASQEMEKAKLEKKAGASKERRSTVANLRKSLEQARKSGGERPSDAEGASPPGTAQTKSPSGSAPKSPTEGGQAPSDAAPSPSQPGSAPSPSQPGSTPRPSQPGSAPNPSQPGSAPSPSQPGSAPRSPSQNPPENPEAV